MNKILYAVLIGFMGAIAHAADGETKRTAAAQAAGQTDLDFLHNNYQPRTPEQVEQDQARLQDPTYQSKLREQEDKLTAEANDRFARRVMNHPTIIMHNFQKAKERIHQQFEGKPSSGADPDDKPKKPESGAYEGDALTAAIQRRLAESSKKIDQKMVDRNVDKAIALHVQQETLEQMGPGMLKRILTKGVEMGASQAVAEVAHEGASVAIDAAVTPFKKLYTKLTTPQEEFELEEKIAEQEKESKKADKLIKFYAAKAALMQKQMLAEELEKKVTELEEEMKKEKSAEVAKLAGKKMEPSGLEPIAAPAA